MKHGNGFYMQLSRELFKEPYDRLSINAKWLFVTLNELEQRFVVDEKASVNYFTRSDKQLAEDTGMSISTIKRAKAELIKTDLVETRKSHVIYSCGKKSEQHYTAYRILK